MADADQGRNDAAPEGVTGRLGLLLAGVLALATIGALTLVNRDGGSGAPDGGASRDHVVTPSGSSEQTQAADPVGCAVNRSRRGPVVDLGVQSSRGGDDELSPARVRRLVALAKQAGAEVISTIVGFDHSQPERGSVPSFDSLDLTVAAARRAGLDVRLTVVGMPGWASDAGAGERYRPPRSAAELQRWQDFLVALLGHVGEVEYLEVWHDPNASTQWVPNENAAEFARLLKASAEVIRDLSPGTRIISGGIRGNDVGYLRKLYEALDGARPFDLLGVRPTRSGRGPADDDGLSEFVSFTGYRALREVTSEHGHKVPMYFTQFGYQAPLIWSGLSDEERAQYLTDAFRIVTCTPYVRALSWYHLHPTPWDAPAWSLLNPGLRPTETYRALKRWATRRASKVS